MEIEVVSVNAAVSMTKEEFLRGFTGPGERGALDFLTERCRDCKEINYDPHFGPYVMFTAEADVFEKAKRQILKATARWLAPLR